MQLSPKKLSIEFEAVARSIIKPCRKQPSTCRIKICSECCAVRENENLLLGSAEGHEYPDLHVGDEVDPRLFLIPIKIYNIDPL